MSRPEISIVVPLPDHRGHALEGLRSWREQTLAAAYQIVVIVDGREPEVERAAAEILGLHDLVVTVPGGSLHDCYNAGARAAAADLLLFTESHVKAEPDCLEQVLARMAVGDLDLAALASGGIDENRFAAQEQTIYEESLEERIAGGWNLCTVRGFAVARSAFERSGGFQARYGHMSELLLGAMLKHQGARLGYAPLARVWHFNDGTVEHFARELAEFGRDEIRFRAEQPDSPLLAYLGPCPVWEERETFHRGAALNEFWSSLGRAFSGLAGFQFKEFGRGLEAAVRAIPFIALGPTWLAWRAAVSCAAATASLSLAYLSDSWYYAAFRYFWNSEIRRGRAEAVALSLSESALEQPKPAAAEVPAPDAA